jgi:uncharacterized protein YchJ
MTHMPLLAACAWQMKGHSAKYLLKAVNGGGMTLDFLTGALFLAVAWSKEHVQFDDARLTEEMRGKLREMFTAEVVAHARQMARQADPSSPSKMHLHALAELTQDEGLIEILGKKEVEASKAETSRFIEETVALARKPLREVMVEKPNRDHISGGQPVRRSVPKYEPNGPCHCGSGKKYKRCCREPDRARLRLSSNVAGKTVAEAQATLESDMTAGRLEKTHGSELARMDIRKLAPELWPAFLLRLAAYSLYDELASAWEKIGVPPELEDLWKELFSRVVRSGDRKTLERMLLAHPKEREMLDELTPGVRLLFSAEWPETWIETLDEEALAALKTDDSGELQRFASAVLFSQCSALGVFVARSMLPIVNKTEAHYLLKEILGTRDRLGLPPNDPYTDIVDERFAEHVADDSQELRASRQSLLRSTNRERQLQAELVESQRTLAQLAKRNGAAAEEKTSAAPDTADAVRALREKNDRLKAQLRAANADRTQNRNRTQELEAEMAKRVAAKQPEAEKDEEAGIEITFPGNQPIRLVEFPRRFGATLAEFPQKVAKAAMQLIGELAAAEPSAFVGLKQMHKCHEVVEQKVKRDYRLLFVLEGRWLRIIDLVDRRDLKATLNKLRANGLPPAETRIAA